MGADRRGVDMGPSAIRYAGVSARLQSIGYDVADTGDILVNRPNMVGEARLKYLDEIERVNRELCQRVARELNNGRFPLVMGGDHSIAIGTISGILQQQRNPGVIWFDAHGDSNTVETTPTGNIHGMPAAVCMGIGHERLTGVGNCLTRINPQNFVMVGIRDLDPGEKQFLKEMGLTVFTMHEIDMLGISEVMHKALAIAADGTDGIHVSFDMDVVDPLHAPGVGTPVPGGLTYRESHFAMELLSAANLVTSAEFVEVNTVLDNRNQTAKMAVALMGSLLGEKLL